MSSGPQTPPLDESAIPHVTITHDDLALLDFLTSDSPLHDHPKSRYRRRDEVLDPLLMAAAVASGPHVTRHHYHHDFFPDTDDNAPLYDWSSWTGEKKETRYVSKQAPRSERLKALQKAEAERQTLRKPGYLTPSISSSELSDSFSSADESPSLSPSSSFYSTDDFGAAPEATGFAALDAAAVKNTGRDIDVDVKCMVRTRVPTPHGEVFLHLYHNNRDNKEHLAIVVDPAQLLEDHTETHAPFIRSRSLDAVWPDETPMDRITRGAYVGRLSSLSQNPSNPAAAVERPGVGEISDAPSPLVRIHSECFTGETIGSMRCDCGEQLDEALRQLFQPMTLRTTDGSEVIVPGRGAVVYMRQEGRGIGLLAKLRAYNLQDLGHDTVSANLMLGRGADERGYEVAAAILRDLGLGDGESDRQQERGIRLLTNNPDKVAALEDAGVRVAERVPMIPRTWRCQDEDHSSSNGGRTGENIEEREARRRMGGVTLLGGGTAKGDELEKYLRTKVLRMGHMLSLPPSGGVESVDTSDSE